MQRFESEREKEEKKNKSEEVCIPTENKGAFALFSSHNTKTNNFTCLLWLEYKLRLSISLITLVLYIYRFFFFLLSPLYKDGGHHI